MAKRKDTKAAQAAIDEAQAALAAAEDALGNKPANAYPEAEDAPQGEPESVAEANYRAIVTYDEPVEAAPGRTVAFTVADALIQLGTDAQFASSHAIHRTVIAVTYHDDGSVSVGAHVGEVRRFSREDAARVALDRASRV